MAQRFGDRAEAGRALGEALAAAHRGRLDALVLGLPRGGVPVAYEVALALDVPLDVFIVRKIGMPGHEEFAIGAIASGGMRALDRDAIATYRVSWRTVEAIIAREQEEISRREQLYRDDRPPLEVQGRSLILVDDGLATGWTMRAAVATLRERAPKSITVAVPVAATETVRSFEPIVDEILVLEMPEPFYAVGMWYEDFSQTTDEEVHDLLQRAAARTARP